MRAHQIMTRKVITVKPDTSIADAANTMLQQHISGLPVINEAGNLVGIISEGDFIRRAEIGTQRKRGRWLRILVGPGRAANDFVHEQGRKVAETGHVPLRRRFRLNFATRPEIQGVMRRTVGK